jgi:hypothetical protein
MKYNKNDEFSILIIKLYSCFDCSNIENVFIFSVNSFIIDESVIKL